MVCFYFTRSSLQAFSHLNLSAPGTDLEVFPEILLSLLRFYILIYQLALCLAYFDGLSRFDDLGFFPELSVFDCCSSGFDYHGIVLFGDCCCPGFVLRRIVFFLDFVRFQLDSELISTLKNTLLKVDEKTDM